MSEHTNTTDSELGTQLDAWGARERARLAAPPEPFIRQVRAAGRPRELRRVARRVLEGLALAAAVALVAYVALRPSPPSEPRPTPVVRSTPDASPTTLAGMTRRAVETGTLDWLLEPAPPAAAEPAASPPSPAPARAADAYCAGCIEELTRL